MQRSLEPEILDTLPHDHPAALHNRRDLRLTNRVMRNHRWIVRTLPDLLRPGERILELGAGTGELGLRLARLGVIVDGIDLWARPQAWPDAAAWHQTDLRTFDRWHEYPVLIANLILHQFSNDELRALGGKFARARLIIACEPTRQRVSQILYRTFAPLFGANEVSLHDAHVSIAAGFRETELPRALELAPPVWRVDCATAFPGAYHMVATRRP